MQKIDQLRQILRQSKLYHVYDDLGELSVDPKIVSELSEFLLFHIQQLGLDHAQEICREIVPKTVGFCGLVASGLIDLGKILPLMKLTSLVYLLDQTVDRSQYPEQYFRIIKDLVDGADTTESKRVRDTINEFDLEDRALIRKLSFGDVSLQQFFLRQCALRFFSKESSDQFLNENLMAISSSMVTDVGLQFIACGTYMLLHKNSVVKTPLSKVMHPQKLIRILEGFLRVSDDFGDRSLDENQNINMFINGQPSLPMHIAQTSMIQLDKPGNNQWLQTFEVYFKASTDELATLEKVDNDTKVLIKLLLRVMEGGFVNIVGDNYLTEGYDSLEENSSDILKQFGYTL